MGGLVVRRVGVSPSLFLLLTSAPAPAAGMLPPGTHDSTPREEAVLTACLPPVPPSQPNTRQSTPQAQSSYSMPKGLFLVRKSNEQHQEGIKMGRPGYRHQSTFPGWNQAPLYVIMTVKSVKSGLRSSSPPLALNSLARHRSSGLNHRSDPMPARSA